jgi:hypothetical protein
METLELALLMSVRATTRIPQALTTTTPMNSHWSVRMQLMEALKHTTAFSNSLTHGALSGLSALLTQPQLPIWPMALSPLGQLMEMNASLTQTIPHTQTLFQDRTTL